MYILCHPALVAGSMVGIQSELRIIFQAWIPAYAGMTKYTAPLMISEIAVYTSVAYSQ